MFGSASDILDLTAISKHDKSRSYLKLNVDCKRKTVHSASRRLDRASGALGAGRGGGHRSAARGGPARTAAMHGAVRCHRQSAVCRGRSDGDRRQAPPTAGNRQSSVQRKSRKPRPLGLLHGDRALARWRSAAVGSRAPWQSIRPKCFRLYLTSADLCR